LSFGAGNQEDVYAFPSQSQGNGAPDTAACPGYDRYLSIQFKVHIFLRDARA
jgi:hypothetical protein